MDKFSNIYRNNTISYIMNNFMEVITVFGRDIKLMTISVLAALSMNVIGLFEKYVYFDFTLFVLFNVSLFLDLLSAITLSNYRGDGFMTNKAMKFVIKFLAYNYVLYLSNIFNILASKVDGFSETIQAILGIDITSFNISPYAVFAYGFIINSFSVLKNFQLAGAFKNIPGFDRWIYKNIDIYKNRPTDRLWDILSEEKKEKILKMS